jgi:hypothetical protein
MVELNFRRGKSGVTPSILSGRENQNSAGFRTQTLELMGNSVRW